MIELGGMGSFHVGGRTVEVRGEPMRSGAVTSTTTLTWDPNGHYAIEAAYVQWFRPARPATDVPVLFVHGGGLTGAMWETTPDGRPGWVELFLRRGVPVFVMDAVERGRAGWCALPGVWPDAPLARSAEWAWTLFRFGTPEGCAARRPFPGCRFPVAHMDAFVRSFVPRWLSTTPAHVAALVLALERIGPASLVCHGQGGEVALQAAAARPDLVRSVVAVELSGFAALDPARHRLLTVLGGLWHDEAASGRRAAMVHFADSFAAQNGRSDVLDMDALGRNGHTHMPMMDRGSEVLAAKVLRWLLDEPA